MSDFQFRRLHYGHISTFSSPPPPLSLSPGSVSTDDIQVLGCGVVSWKPPANTGGERPGYAIRFFDGDTYETSTYREVQRYFDDPGRQWAVAASLPSTRPIYADVRVLSC